jgi:hypothetical protein
MTGIVREAKAKLLRSFKEEWLENEKTACGLHGEKLEVVFAFEPLPPGSDQGLKGQGLGGTASRDTGTGENLSP